MKDETNHQQRQMTPEESEHLRRFHTALANARTVTANHRRTRAMLDEKILEDSLQVMLSEFLENAIRKGLLKAIEQLLKRAKLAMPVGGDALSLEQIEKVFRDYLDEADR